MTQHDFEIGQEIGRQIKKEHIDPLNAQIDSLKAELERVNELASERLVEIGRLKGTLAKVDARENEMRDDLVEQLEEKDAYIKRLEAGGEIPAMSAEQLAQKFHDIYERRAPEYGYTTRKSSAVPWSAVPEPNKSLMIAVCNEILSD